MASKAETALANTQAYAEAQTDPREFQLAQNSAWQLQLIVEAQRATALENAIQAALTTISDADDTDYSIYPGN